jgi:hypothetical protein
MLSGTQNPAATRPTAAARFLACWWGARCVGGESPVRTPMFRIHHTCNFNHRISPPLAFGTRKLPSLFSLLTAAPCVRPSGPHSNSLMDARGAGKSYKSPVPLGVGACEARSVSRLRRQQSGVRGAEKFVHRIHRAQTAT